MEPQRYRCKHPHTDEWVMMTNGEWRRAKALLPIDCSKWLLLAREEEYEILLTCVAEQIFDKPTMEWLVDQLRMFPRSVVESPIRLTHWYSYMCDMYDITNVVRVMAEAKMLQDQLAVLAAKRKKDVGIFARKIQREIKKLQKLKARQARIKARRAKLSRRR